MKKLSLVLLALLPVGIEAAHSDIFQRGNLRVVYQASAPYDVVEEEFSDAAKVDEEKSSVANMKLPI